MANQDKPETTNSPLRGNLEDNDFDGDLHDMGGNIGPASDATAASDPSPASEGVREAEERAAETGATAVDSPIGGVLRDDPDDPAGGDTGNRQVQDPESPQ
jgi:hypothetical protein